ncbi:MAG TPA: DUF4157 domain-containing protein [Syntrophobacteria bacterium]|nr:DUF4157 domain-containing protein [Syntrophobacteria bacterium]
MPEQDYPDRPFPLRTRLDPPRAVQRAARLFRLLLARSAFGVRGLPVISAGAAWAKILMKGGERLDASHPMAVLEFLRPWSGAEAEDGAVSRARTSKDPGSAGSPEGLRRSGSPPAREEGLSLPAAKKRPSRLDGLAALAVAGTDPADALWETTHAFPKTARTAGWQMVRQDRAPAETARASSEGSGSPTLRPAAQAYEGEQSNHGVEWFRPVPRKPYTVLLEPATARTLDLPALSSAETLVSRIFGTRAFLTARDHPEAASGLSARRGDSVSLLHAGEAPQGMRSGFPQTQRFAYAAGDVDSAPSWSLQAAHSLGRPLGVIPRVILERSFPDLNLSQVRVHTDAPADVAARELGADAFVLGPDLFFRSGTFNPLSERGLALLTHELVHVRQSGDGSAPASMAERERLESEALRAEVLHRFPAVTASPRRSWTGLDGVTGRFSSRQLPPVTLGFAHPGGAEPMHDRGGRNSPQGSRSVPLERLADSRPLTAGAGRTGATQEQAAGEGGAASGAEGLEGLTRHVFRALERKIGIEKERRGIDRWAL